MSSIYRIITAFGATYSPAGVLLILCLAALALSGCSTWGAGHSAEAALGLDLQDPDKGVLVPLERNLTVDEPFWVRLDLASPTEADHVIVRFEFDVGGRSYFEVQDYRFEDLIPPWDVAAIPLSISQPGDWNIALIVNSRKITDVKVTVER